ncbi:unnamed protein product [Merluccius merluccius]
MSHLVKDFCVEEQEVLYGASSHYLVESFRGEGSFGKVATCLNMDTRQTVAIKILQKAEEDMVGGEEEIAMLQQLRALDPDAYNIVRWFEHFVHRGHTCLVFEMLDISLFDYMNARHLQPLSLLEMSLITQQLAVSFEVLKVMGVIHADLKGDNIMFVNQRDKPLKVKLIDFGLAVPISEVELGDTLQALPYRAPEVVLGLPISEAIDIWSLGCVIASMFLGAHLYPSCRDEYELLTCIMDTHGLPSERMLEYGVKSHWYFTKDQGSLNNGWRLKLYPEEDEDVLVEFVELLKGMLEVDPHRRMNPSNILQHPFVSLLPKYYGHSLILMDSLPEGLVSSHRDHQYSHHHEEQRMNEEEQQERVENTKGRHKLLAEMDGGGEERSQGGGQRREYILNRILKRSKQQNEEEEEDEKYEEHEEDDEKK